MATDDHLYGKSTLTTVALGPLQVSGVGGRKRGYTLLIAGLQGQAQPRRERFVQRIKAAPWGGGIHGSGV